MTLRAGSYDASRPQWRGVIRNDGSAWFVCTHRDHKSRGEARDCARLAMPAFRQAAVRAARGEDVSNDPMPDGWRVYVRSVDHWEP